MCTDDPRDSLLVPIASLSTCHHRHPPPRRPSLCPSPIPSPCQSLMLKFCTEDSQIAHHSCFNKTTHVSPCHLAPLSSLNPTFPYLSLFFLSISPLDFLFGLVQRSKQNTINALTLCLQSCPSIHRLLPLKLNTDLSFGLHRCAGLSPATHIPFFSSFSYSQIFCSILVLSQHRQHINTHRPPC